MVSESPSNTALEIPISAANDRALAAANASTSSLLYACDKCWEHEAMT